MASIKLTKNELKKQKDDLKQFQRYLPTLQLKKQQLQTVIMQIDSELQAKQMEYNAKISSFDDWVAVLAENKQLLGNLKIQNLINPDKIICKVNNIAGVKIPVFSELTFKEVSYDVDDYPLWVDKAIVEISEVARLKCLIKTLKKQSELLNRELRLTSQRVNLFEKVKIPEAKENIRIIEIYLGDQQTSAVVRGKIAKSKRQVASS